MATEEHLYTGNVTAVNEKGLKLDATGDDWLNFTREEWRGSWYEPRKGEGVTIQCQPDKNGRLWVKSIVLNGHQDWSEPEAPPKGTPSTTRDLSIVRQVALKCATEVVVACINRDAEYVVTNPADYAINICALAQDLEQWATRE